MISRRQGESNEAYFTYVEKAGDAANKDSTLIWTWNIIIKRSIVIAKFMGGKMHDTFSSVGFLSDQNYGERSLM